MKLIRNLEVPWFSQRENNTYWHEKYPISTKKVDEEGKSLAGCLVENGTPVSMAQQSCNITSLAMVLHYFGVTSDTPDVMMRKVFEPSEDELLNYTADQIKLVEAFYVKDDVFESAYNLKSFAKDFYNIESEVSEIKSFENVKEYVLAGFPVIISCGIIREFDETAYIDRIKNEACINVFTNDKKAVYDTKMNEYNASINSLTIELRNELNSEIEQDAISKQIAEVQGKIKKLEDAYKIAKIFYLDYFRFRGHYVVVRGITDKGVIINDPWGKPIIQNNGKGEYSLMVGDNIYISQTDFNKQFYQNNRFHACIILKGKHWNFISHAEKFNVNNENFLEECHKAEQFDFGGFPIKRSNLWHNGLHFGSVIGSKIYPIGAGQLVAARIVNKDTATKEEPSNGSRCFVLVKHQIITDTVLKDFFVLYMHLKPIDNFEAIISDYPSKKTNIKWIDELLQRSKVAKRLSLLIKDQNFYELTDINGEKSVGKLPKSGVFIVESVDKALNTVIFYYENKGVIGKYWANTNVIDIAANTDVYIKKLEELQSGKTIYFNDKSLIDVDSMIEVTSSSPIGFMGEYGGYDSNNKMPSLHVEIFTNENIITTTEGFTVIKESDIPVNLKNSKAMCDREEMIKFFEDKNLYGNFLSSFIYLKEDGIITKSEMKAFYESSDGAKKFENYICQHLSEWYEDINWTQALEQAKGVSNKGLATLLSKNEDFEGTLNEYVSKIYNPYKWFNKECIVAMNTNSSFFNHGYATFYHPARFILWLNENEK